MRKTKLKSKSDKQRSVKAWAILWSDGEEIWKTSHDQTFATFEDKDIAKSKLANGHLVPCTITFNVRKPKSRPKSKAVK